jgi:hypothetical protein
MTLHYAENRGRFHIVPYFPHNGCVRAGVAFGPAKAENAGN